MVHVPGKHGRMYGAACPDGAKQPRYPADVGVTGQYGSLCLAKYTVLLMLAEIQFAMMTGMYYISAAIACTGLWIFTASIVPSVLMINTKVWFIYPMDYPFYVITAKYGELAANLYNMLTYCTQKCIINLKNLIRIS